MKALPKLAARRAQRVVDLFSTGVLGQADALRQLGDVMRMDGVNAKLVQPYVDAVMGEEDGDDAEMEAEVYRLWKEEELP